MNKELGDETTRAIMIKYRHRLKALLAEHEVKAGYKSQMILLVELCQRLETENQKFA